MVFAMNKYHFRAFLPVAFVIGSNVTDFLQRFKRKNTFTFQQFIYSYDKSVVFTKIGVVRLRRDYIIVGVSRIKLTAGDLIFKQELRCWMDIKDADCHDFQRQDFLKLSREMATKNFVEKYKDIQNMVDKTINQLMFNDNS